MKRAVEKSELDCTFCEKSMEIHTMVSCGIVMLMVYAPTVTVVCTAVPDFLCFFVREVLVLFHCIKECFVKLVTPAVFTITDFKSLIDQILPSCHEVYQSSERCRCVIGSVNMDVNTTAAMGFCSVLAKLSYNDLQELNVFIVEWWCNHFYSVFIHRSI